MLVIERARAGPLGAVATKHAVLLRRQPGAPLFIGLLHRKLLFGLHGRHLMHAANQQCESNRSAAGSSSTPDLRLRKLRPRRHAAGPDQKATAARGSTPCLESITCLDCKASSAARCGLVPTTNRRPRIQTNGASWPRAW